MVRCGCGLGATAEVDLGSGIKINKAQKFYVIPSGRGYTTLGFDVVKRRTNAIAKWTGDRSLAAPAKVGTKTALRAYLTAMLTAEQYAMSTRSRCPAELTPQLVGLEGKRVEVVDSYGDKRRFIVGKSTGWLPVHLEIKTRSSSGGGAVTGAPFRSIHVV